MDGLPGFISLDGNFQVFRSGIDGIIIGSACCQGKYKGYNSEKAHEIVR
jgi:hypothetical protein